MKIALIQSPQWDLELPPLGLTYLSAYLKKEKHETKIFDLNIDLFHEIGENYRKYWKVGFEFDEHWRNPQKMSEMSIINEEILDKWASQILKWKPDIIGFTVLVNTKLVSMLLAKKIKEFNPNIVIIFGGQECPKDRSGLEFIKSGFIDIVVQGEGEEALAQIVNKIKNNEKIDNLPGVLLFKNNQIIDGGYSKPIYNLNLIPFPDFDAVSLDKYMNKEALPMLTSRGCINRCVYCSETLFWNIYRFRSAENIFEEMKLHMKKYKRNVFYFNDSLLNGNIKELEKLCDIIIESKEDIKWLGNACVRKEMTSDLLKKMKNAGCEALVYGIESASDKVLRSMEKNYDSKIAEKVVRDTSREGILTVTNWILGFPKESKIDFFKTIMFLVRNRNYIKISRPGGSPFVVLASTILDRNYKDFGIVLNDRGPTWTSEDGTNTREMRERRIKILRLVAKHLNMLT